MLEFFIYTKTPFQIPDLTCTLLLLCRLLYIPEDGMPAFVVDGVYFEVMPKVCVALNQSEKCKILFVELLITFNTALPHCCLPPGEFVIY